MKKHGIAYHEKVAGQILCDLTSREIINMLLTECSEAGVKIRTECNISSGSQREIYLLSRLTPKPCNLLRSLSQPAGFLFQKSVRRRSATRLPGNSACALCRANRVWCRLRLPLKTGKYSPLSPAFRSKFARGATARGFRESMLFTHKGLSGPAILQLLSDWNPGDPIAIDLLPESRYSCGIYEQPAGNTRH